MAANGKKVNAATRGKKKVPVFMGTERDYLNVLCTESTEPRVEDDAPAAQQ